LGGKAGAIAPEKRVPMTMSLFKKVAAKKKEAPPHEPRVLEESYSNVKIADHTLSQQIAHCMPF
jgi:hypothetical protein